MSNIEIPEFLKSKKEGESSAVIGAGSCPAKPTDMTKADVEALSCKIRAMSREELEVVLDNIPVEMMLPRIESELRKRQAFIDRINGVTDAFSR